MAAASIKRTTAPPACAALQVTSNFSFLCGASHPDELAQTAKQLGLAAIAISDRNTLAGVVRMHVAAKEAGLRLLVGARLVGEDAPELLCFPHDRAAYGRLSRLISLGQRRAGKGACRLTLADIAAHQEGQSFVVLPPQQGIGSFDAVLQRLRDALDTPLYLALDHRCAGDEAQRFARLRRQAEACGIAPVAAPAVLYHAPERKPLQDVLTCIREKCRIDDAGLRLDANAEAHLKPPAELARLYKGHADALARTIEIVERCRFSLDEIAYDYPLEPVPEGLTPQQQLETLTLAGAAQRFPQGLPQRVQANLAHEFRLIDELDFAPYFLTMHDIVGFARARGILCQGRGSAANSTVCYCLGITNVDPTQIDLLFERFISAERGEPPDIDVDFEHERREEVIQYIYQRFGREHAGLAAALITYRPRSAVRDVGKAMGLSEDIVSRLAGTVWGWGHDGIPIERVREAGLDPRDPRLMRTLQLTAELVGFPRHLSQHVGGFVLTRSPLDEIVPIGNAAMAGRTVIEWDKEDLAALKLLKVDVLALGMLSCVHRAFDLLETHHNRRLTLATLPREDRATYDMLCRADSLGVFQIESRAQMNMLPRLKPRCFYDLVIEVAIVRPGPIQGDMVHPYLRRRDGLEPETYPAPGPAHGPADELRSILGKTKGVPLFQEQAMRLAMVAAQFSPAEANALRRSMATFRRRGTIELLRDKMVGRMVARGYDAGFAERCFEQIKGFGDYGFPESHAASFAHLVYVSAWLKCHYPAVFACALLNSQPMGFYAPAQIVRDAREHGVELRPVDVSCSDWDCTLEAGERGGFALRLGLRQISGLRRDEAERIVAARARAQIARSAVAPPQNAGASLPPPQQREVSLCKPITSNKKGRDREVPSRSGGGAEAPLRAANQVAPPAFPDIEALREQAGVRRETLERLAAADAFRSLGPDRRQALWQIRALPDAPPLPLFAWAAARETAPEADIALPRLPLSAQVLEDYRHTRLSLKAHPLRFLRRGLSERGLLSCAELRQRRDGDRLRMAGVVLVRQRPGTAKGVVFMTIEDETGIANLVVWAKVMERFRRTVMTARLIEVHGRVQRHKDIIHVIAERLEDRTDWLGLLEEDARRALDEQQRAARHRLPPPIHRRHPRNERIIPRSRDFH
jgi:error-prone DNA polymerase